MKIIAGKYKGRNVLIGEIQDSGFRPTKGIVRESVFNILEHGGIEGGVKDKVWMDVCCGCGIMGFEAISRGAAKVFMIDNNIEHKSNILNTMAKMDLKEEVYFLHYNIINIPDGDAEIDIAYIDPPYDSKLSGVILKKLYECNWLKDKATVIIETGEYDDDIEFDSTKYDLTSDRIYGNSRVRFFTYCDN